MAKRKPQPFGTHYLKSAHVDAFGALFQRDLGPYTPGLNVVFGANEAGKTTASAFIGGVLFGWPEARGGRNAYRPAGAHRCGTLVFEPRRKGAGARGGKGAGISCTREKNAEGIKPDPHPPILDDIDEETYRTIFSLNSDELLGLGGGSDITSHLLTAGAGTAISPARALEEVDARLAACHSRSANYPDSISNLSAEIARTNDDLEAAANEAAQFKQEARERAALGPELEEAQARLAALNEEVETLGVQTAALERLQQEALSLAEEDRALREREVELGLGEGAPVPDGSAPAPGDVAPTIDNDLPAPDDAAPASLPASDGAPAPDDTTSAPGDGAPVLDEARYRLLREELDELAAAQARLEHDRERIEEDYVRARANYYVAAGGELRAGRAVRETHRRRVLAALCFVLPAVFALAAMFLFARSSAEDAPIVLGFAVVFALAALAFAGIGPYLLSRQGAAAAASEQRIDVATRELEEVEQRMSVAEERLEAHRAAVARSLEDAGLSQARGSVRRARALLDDMRERQASEQLRAEQRLHAATTRSALDASIARNEREQAAAYKALGEDAQTPLAALRARLAEKSKERDNLQARAAEMSARAGQLDARLDRAVHLRSFDQLKLEGAQLATRMAEAQEEYAELLLVRRMLEEAILAWEDKSQPAVYQQAGRLLSLMTDGAWTRVFVNGQGDLAVADAFGNEREPNLLSLGTCQQLYLALRIALLMTAENVGRSIPIICDDILVNFDGPRRIGAAKAIEELSRVRQVIMFTCHEEIVRLMQEACAEVNSLEL